MQCQGLFAHVDALNEKYIRFWADVCNLESPTNDKAGVDRVGAYFIERAKAFGWAVEELECEAAGNAVCITMNPDADAPSVVFSGHMDTVHPVGSFGSPAVRLDEERIYGPGVIDCKGGTVASMMAMEALMLSGFTARPVKLILQSDEETSSKNSGKKTIEFMCEKAKGAVAFLNTEGRTGGNPATLVRKGIARYRFDITGKSVHSAACPDGANAIAEAAHKILQLEKFKDADGITCNCGVINGGTVANVVASDCSFLTDFRYADAEQFALVEKTVHGLAENSAVEGCTCQLTEISTRPAMPLEQRNVDLFDKINAIYGENGLPELTFTKTAGGSDAAYATAAGIPCIDSIGVYGGGTHSVREFAYLSSLAEAAKRLASVAYCI